MSRGHKISLIVLGISIFTNMKGMMVNGKHEKLCFGPEKTTNYFSNHKTNSRDNFYFGPKIGANYSTVYDVSGENFNASAKFGGVVGMYFSVGMGKFLGVQPEILFSQKGFKATGRMYGSDYTLYRTTSWIDVPLMFAVKPTGFLTLLAGPQYSYLVHQLDIVDNGLNSSLHQEAFRNDNIHKNILCFIGGADLKLSPLIFGVRMGWDVQKNNGDGTSETPRYKNVWYQATIGIKLF